MLASVLSGKAARAAGRPPVSNETCRMATLSIVHELSDTWLDTPVEGDT